MTNEVHAHIVNRLHTMLAQTMMGDYTFRKPEVARCDSLGLTIKADAILGLDTSVQPRIMPVVLILVPGLRVATPTA